MWSVIFIVVVALISNQSDIDKCRDECNNKALELNSDYQFVYHCKEVNECKYLLCSNNKHRTCSIGRPIGTKTKCMDMEKQGYQHEDLVYSENKESVCIHYCENDDDCLTGFVCRSTDKPASDTEEYKVCRSQEGSPSTTCNNDEYLYDNSCLKNCTNDDDCGNDKCSLLDPENNLVEHHHQLILH